MLLSGRPHVGLQAAVRVEVVGNIAAFAEELPRSGQEKTQPDQTIDLRMRLEAMVDAVEILEFEHLVALADTVWALLQNHPHGAEDIADSLERLGQAGNPVQYVDQDSMPFSKATLALLVR